MNLRIVILKAKQRADGSNKIRIAVSHNSTTRYIPTRFVVDGERNLRNGVVVNMANAAYINQQLRTQLNKIYTIFDSLEDRDAYTCSQLIKVIKHKMTKGTIRTVEEIDFEMLRVNQHSWSKGTITLHKDGIVDDSASLRLYGKFSLLVRIAPAPCLYSDELHELFRQVLFKDVRHIHST